jgi:hypothetical protein
MHTTWYLIFACQGHCVSDIPGFTARTRSSQPVRCPLSSAFAPRRAAKAAPARLEVVHDQVGKGLRAEDFLVGEWDFSWLNDGWMDFDGDS